MSDELVMVDELLNLGEESANDARAYLSTVTEVASGSSPDTAIPVLLLAVSQVLVAGARLGAITDVVPDERFEADPGPDVDVDPIRQGLVSLLNGLDDDVDVVVQTVQQADQSLTYGVDVDVGTWVGFEPLIGHDVGDGTKASPGDQNLRNREQQNWYGGIWRGTRGNLGDRGQVGAGLARRVFAQIGQLAQVRQLIKHRALSSPRRPDQG